MQKFNRHNKCNHLNVSNLSNKKSDDRSVVLRLNLGILHIDMLCLKSQQTDTEGATSVVRLLSY